jgi:hypothetical protein
VDNSAVAHQQAQSVDQLRLTLLQRGQARFDGRYLSGGFGDVQVGGDTVGQAQLREFQAVAGDVEVLLGDGSGALHTAQLNVVLGGLGEHRQQHAAPVVFRDFQGGVGGFGFATYTAPEIQFPGRGEACVPQVVRRVTVVSRRIVQAFAAVAFTPVAASGGGIRVTVGGDHLTHGAALLQTAAGEFQVEVVGQGALSQGREFRVVEHFPPTFIHGLGDGLAGGGPGRFRPLGHLLRLRFLEVRANGAGVQ